MSTDSIFERAVSSQGWNDHSQRLVLEEYISNQDADDAFSDHLKECAKEEGEDPSQISGNIIEFMGWNDSSMVSRMLSYISNQDADDVFTDFIAQKVASENVGESTQTFTLTVTSDNGLTASEVMEEVVSSINYFISTEDNPGIRSVEIVPVAASIEAKDMKAFVLLVAQTMGDWKPDQLKAHGLDAIYEEATKLLA